MKRTALTIVLALWSSLAWAQFKGTPAAFGPVGWAGQDDRIDSVRLSIKNVTAAEVRIVSVILSAGGQELKTESSSTEWIDLANKDRRMTFAAIIGANLQIQLRGALPVTNPKGFTRAEIAKDWTNITAKVLLSDGKTYEVVLKDEAMKSINEVISFLGQSK